jgi:hypothetical protein
MGTEERAAIRFPFYRGIRPPGTALQAHGRDRRSEQGSTHGEHQPSTPGRQGCLGAPLSPLPFRSRGSILVMEPRRRNLEFSSMEPGWNFPVTTLIPQETRMKWAFLARDYAHLAGGI